jgi:hypothetical protein
VLLKTSRPLTFGEGNDDRVTSGTKVLEGIRVLEMSRVSVMASAEAKERMRRSRAKVFVLKLIRLS